MVDINKLASFLPYISVDGHTINIEQRARLESAEKILLKNYKLQKIALFGRVTGVRADYLVCLGYKASDLLTPAKIFYSFDGTDWKLLLEVPAAKAKVCQKINSFFMGDPSHVYTVPIETYHAEPAAVAPVAAPVELPKTPESKKKVRDDDASSTSSRSSIDVNDLGDEGDLKKADAVSVSSDEGEEEPAKEPRCSVEIREITEEVRLSALVRGILAETALAPRGALQLTPKLEVVQNPGFEGIANAQANQASSYLHVRPSKVSHNDVDWLLSNLDFLDPISADTPNGVWSIRTDASDSVVSIRHLQWPGSLFFHVKGTNQYASAYFGTGVKNNDFAFMV
eukprot:gnl/Hemi2/19108_TR6337_c0_g1_i1.p1 gnl/Hemi2/19108_TR6337_c0_g1~~gnl/Hemi2/19108_TR6337_c0_g1_i1.p1  ORF type:complete len:385 (-),score=142.35 gnl/Hemi2/19108_TR6337_c0_g1_i1:217-1236(-)